MSEWDEPAKDWDDSEAVRIYADAAFSSLTQLLDELGFEFAGATVCDFGCGTGLMTERLAAGCTRIDAVDTSSGMLAVLDAKVERHGWDHVRLLDRLPAVPMGYDLIVCSSVLGFVDDYSVTAAALVEQLAPGGVFVQWDWEAEPDGDDPHGLSRADVRRTLEAAGLESVAVGTAFTAEVEGQMMRPLMGSGRRPMQPTDAT